MDHKDFVNSIAGSMAMAGGNPTPKDLEEERVDEMRRQEKPNDDDVFTINIPMITGRVFKVDARQVDWNALGTPESQANLENNEGTIRAMVHHLITVDFTSEDYDKMVADFDESLTNLFKNFGIEDCGYGELEKNMCSRFDILTNVKRDMLEACIDTNDTVPACDNDDEVFKINEHISETYCTKYELYAERLHKHTLLLGKCFDALTLINVIAHNTAMHGLATQVFGAADSFKEVADLNDITEMDNSTDGLISADRHAFEGVPEDHDVSGLLDD